MPINLKSFSGIKNAGDLFSVDLVRSFISTDVKVVDKEALAETNLILVGSILNWADTCTIVCGAGFIRASDEMPVQPRVINCIRGRLTYDRLNQLGVSCPPIFGDPGVLAPRIFPRLYCSSHELGLIPHYKDLHVPWVELCRRRGVKIIDPRLPLDLYMKELQGCEIILSSSLHGIIFAHAYGKKALWVELSSEVIGDGFKFYDYYSSLGKRCYMPPRFHIVGDEDPYSLSKFAAQADQSDLIDNALMAIFQTKEQVFSAD